MTEDTARVTSPSEARDALMFIGTCFQINLNGGGKVYDYGSQIKIASSTDEEIKVAIKLVAE